MGSFAIIPAAPVLLHDIDRSETSRTAELRSAIEDVLRRRPDWALPIEALPPVAGLGGLGIDRGIEARTGLRLDGQAWVEAVNALSAADRETSEKAHPGVAVAYLHADAAGVRLGPLGSSENLLIPIDLSVAASEDAPLAPVPGAAEAEEELIAALRAGDPRGVLQAAATGHEVHADLTLLESAARQLLESDTDFGGFDVVFDVDLHEVRSLCAAGTY